MENPSITVSVVYTAKDLRPFLFLALKQTIIQTAVFHFLVILVVYIVASRYMVGDLPFSLRIVALVFLVGVPLITILINLYDVQRVARRKAERYGSVTVEIDERGVTSREEGRTAIFSWSAYGKAVEYKDRFVVLSNRVGEGGLLLPKRCFDTMESMDRLRKLLERTLNGEIEIR